MWAWLKEWWEDNKGTVENFVIPKLTIGQPALCAFLVSRGIDSKVASSLSYEVIAWVQNYLRKQL